MTKRLPTEVEKRQLRVLFDNLPEHPCLYCGGYHLRACPRIKRQVWLGNGNCTEVEYWEKWDDSEVIFPEDVFDDEPEESDNDQ